LLPQHEGLSFLRFRCSCRVSAAAAAAALYIEMRYKVEEFEFSPCDLYNIKNYDDDDGDVDELVCSDERKTIMR
jgi:hypothetical protein